jgi:uncharacterized membrane protein YccF (DUF307 family)
MITKYKLVPYIITIIHAHVIQYVAHICNPAEQLLNLLVCVFVFFSVSLVVFHEITVEAGHEF